MKSDSRYLLNESPITCYPTLALALGSDKALIVQQVRYWMEHNSKDPSKRKSHFIDGRWWTYNTFEQWEETFIWLSLRTIKSMFASLKKEGILLHGFFHHDPRNRTSWYSIDFDRLNQIVEIAVQGHRLQNIEDSPIPVIKEWAGEIGLQPAILLSILIYEEWKIESEVAILDPSAFRKIHRLSSEKLKFLDDLQILSRRTKFSYLRQLQNDGWIKRISQDPIALRDRLLSVKSGQSLKAFGRETCQWCKGQTLILHEHHFPILKADGGKDVVGICPNCHTEYHALEDERFFELTQKLAVITFPEVGGVA